MNHRRASRRLRVVSRLWISGEVDRQLQRPAHPHGFMLTLSALMWLKIDPTEQLVPET